MSQFFDGGGADPWNWSLMEKNNDKEMEESSLESSSITLYVVYSIIGLTIINVHGPRIYQGHRNPVFVERKQ